MRTDTIVISEDLQPHVNGDVWVIGPHTSLGRGVRCRRYVVCPDVALTDDLQEWIDMEIRPRVIASEDGKRRATLRAACALLLDVSQALAGESVRTIDEKRRSDQLHRLGARASAMASRCSLAAMADGCVVEIGSDPDPASPDVVLALVRKIARGEQLTGADADPLTEEDHDTLIKLEALVRSTAQLADALAELRGQRIEVEQAEDSLIARAFARLMELDPDWVRAQS